jgi:hypothetical protein
MEALEFIDDDVLMFLALSFTLLVGFVVWFFVKEYRGLNVQDPTPVEVPIAPEPPVLTEPVGIDTETFNKEDKKEVEQVQELVGHFYPATQELSPSYAAPTPVTPHPG